MHPAMHLTSERYPIQIVLGEIEVGKVCCYMSVVLEVDDSSGDDSFARLEDVNCSEKLNG